MKSNMRKNIVLLFQGQFVSMVGTEIAAIVIILWIKNRTGHAALIGLSSMMYSLGVLIFSTFGGTLADLFSKKKIIILCDICSGITSLLFTALIFIEVRSVGLFFGFVLVLQFMLGVFAGIFNPTLMAFLPVLVPKNKIENAMALQGGASHAALLIGQSIGGLLFSLMATPLIFAINGVSFLISAFSESFIRHTETTRTGSVYMKERLKKILAETREGLRFIGDNEPVKVLILAIAMVDLFCSSFIVLLPYTVENNLGLGLQWYGYLLGIFSAGAIFGFLLFKFIKLAGTKRHGVVVALLTIFALLFPVVGFIRSLSLAVCVALVCGVIFAFFQVTSETAMQLFLPSALKGRIFGVNNIFKVISFPVGMTIYGLLFDLTHGNYRMIFIGSSVLFLLAIMMVLLRKSAITILSYENGKNDAAETANETFRITEPADEGI